MAKPSEICQFGCVPDFSDEILLKALSEEFGLSGFRPQQDDIVKSLLAGRNTVVIMPTGGGKSLCYQLPAVLMDGVALVISPLIALMKDQVDALEDRGIAATLINSSLSLSEQSRRIQMMAEGRYRLVYIAPERFRHRFFVEKLKTIKLSFVAIDEAHCISQWGHDFRPDYLRVGNALERLNHPPVHAFTATATPEVRQDIMQTLQMHEPNIFVTGFERKNLEFKVVQVAKRAEKFSHLARTIERLRTGIVYCATRKRVEEVSEQLNEWDVSHIAYHGGMEDGEREETQNEFITGKADVAVATNAFGMGIDRPDLRFVAHFEIPGSVEAYYQEAGRAGRDGLPSECVLYYNYADRRTQDFFIDGSNPDADFVRRTYAQLLELKDGANEIKASIQHLADLVGSRNSMQIGSTVKLLADAGVLERFDIPGERIRGTRILRPDLTPPEIPLDEQAMAMKATRDRGKLEAMILYATHYGCRQVWIRDYFGEKEAEECGLCDACENSSSEKRKPLPAEKLLILRKMLSGVARMSRRGGPEKWNAVYGKGLIAQMLAGSEDKKIHQFGLNRLSTYGILKEEGTQFARLLIESALRAGMLKTTGGMRPLTTLTPYGDAVMLEKSEARMAWPKPNSGRKKLAPRPSLLMDSGENIDPDLLERLRKKRLQLAKVRGNIPPFQILNNRALEGLASLKPSSPEEALSVPGIGPAKVKSIVPAMLEVIASWRKQS